MAIEPVEPNFGHGPPWPLATTRGHQTSAVRLFPQLKGNSFHSSMHPVLKVAGVVHIWYYIPLCTIFASQSNGDIFRTKSHNSKSRSQNPTPISKWDLSTHHSAKPCVTMGSERTQQRELLPKRLLNWLKDWLILAIFRSHSTM
ncbi:hypothetical protein O181_031697 [Austropuccinia psidii MF-1]|uniref:Uncharacterized protein n=1 Tax=Austropuccinia psidii MF-1 TaxID=1389203 RepID=A0A9Q3H5K9_9BASI|nr:hypothetical protein [Austropuccinia psidii MF-1]